MYMIGALGIGFCQEAPGASSACIQLWESERSTRKSSHRSHTTMGIKPWVLHEALAVEKPLIGQLETRGWGWGSSLRWPIAQAPAALAAWLP